MGSSVVLDQLKGILEDLSQEEFSTKTIIDGSILEFLLTPSCINRIEEKAQRVFAKYVFKTVKLRGIEHSEKGRRNIRNAIRARTYLDEVLRLALMYLRIEWPKNIDYHQFMHTLFSKLKGKPIAEWPRIMEDTHRSWIESRGLDPKTAKAVALIIAKTYYQLIYGKLKQENMASEDLYPEL